MRAPQPGVPCAAKWRVSGARAVRKSMTVLGIDIGGTRLKAGCVDESGRILRSAAVTTPSSRDEFRPALIALASEVLKETTAPAAAGIGCKGIIDPATARIVVLPGTL